MTQSTAPAGSGCRFRVSLLGPFRVERDGAHLNVQSWHRRAQNVFKLLALSPCGRLTRDELIDTLWPEASPRAGAGHLRLVLHLLRRGLGTDSAVGSPILSQRDWMVLNPQDGWEVDLRRFVDLATTAGDDIARLEEAARLYRGEPLVENRYDDWAQPARSRVQQLRWRVCGRLAQLSLEQDPDEAVLWAGRLVDDDPLDEAAVQLLLCGLLRAGRTREAARAYGEFAQRLERELGEPPSPQTAALVRELPALPRSQNQAAGFGRGQRATEQQPAVVPRYRLDIEGPLLGRKQELDAMFPLLHPHASENSGNKNEDRGAEAHLALIKAEAGMGKTRLLGEVARRASNEGVLTLAGGCYEGEGHLSYGPLHDALADLVRSWPASLLQQRFGPILEGLVGILPELRESFPDLVTGSMPDVAQQQLWLFTSVARMLEVMAETQPVLLILDDLQWADDSTLALLHFLLRQIGVGAGRPPSGHARGRVLIVGAYRPEEVGREERLYQLASAAAHATGSGLPVATVVELGPLSPEDLATMLRTRMGAICDADVAGLLQARSGGNPFFTLQMVRLLEAEGRLELEAGTRRLTSGTSLDLPGAVKETVARHLRWLDPTQGEVLAFGAVLGRAFPYPDLESMWGQDPHPLFPALDHLVDAHVLITTEEGYEFGHSLLWEVVYERIPHGRRPLLHGRAGLALETVHVRELEGYAPVLAEHFWRARGIHEERAARYNERAGDVAARAFDWDSAADYYQRALALVHEPPDTARLLTKRGTILASAARFEESTASLEHAAEVYERLDDAEALGETVVHLSVVRAMGAASPADTERFERLTHRLQRRISPATLGRAYSSLVHALFNTGEHVRALEYAAKALELAGAVEDDAVRNALQGGVLARAGSNLLVLGRLAEAKSHLEGAIPLLEASEDLVMLPHVYSNLALLHGHYRGDLRTAISCAEMALTLAQRTGDGWNTAFARWVLACQHIWAGEWRTADQHLADIETAMREAGDFVGSAYVQFAAGWLELWRGNLSSAEQTLRRTLELAAGNPLVTHWARRLQGELDIVRDRPAVARVSLETLAKGPLPGAYGRPETLTLLAWATAECSNRLDSLESAGQLAQQAVEAAREAGNRSALVDALRVAGLVSWRRGRGDEAEAALAAAIATAGTLPYPYGEARARRVLGLVYASAGDNAAARDEWMAALATFKTLGARLDAQEIALALAEVAPK